MKHIISSMVPKIGIFFWGMTPKIQYSSFVENQNRLVRNKTAMKVSQKRSIRNLCFLAEPPAS